MNRYICLHGHFYQPPRENPWLEMIERQDSAYPYHDWNERINAECYAPNAASRIFDTEGKIVDIINIYSKISFDFGPTLLSWLEVYEPDVYSAVINADHLSREKFSGHGSALAQAYNHMIMPLANRKDKYTQTIWGIKDFQKRFGRFPEGMWLPEAAVDIETLEVLVSQDIKFTVLSPGQAKRIRRREEPGSWHNVDGGKIDPTRAYLCTLPSGRTMNLFFYDGPISHDISFGGLLKNGEGFAKRILSAFNSHRSWPQIVHLATDGETFGHHHRFGDMALSYALHYIESNNLATITNYGQYLENHPPDYEVEIYENSSWSCVHGVERWRADCGCKTGSHAGWTQEWRKPLRDAMDWLRDSLVPLYEKEAADFFCNVWNARNDYIEVILDRSDENVETFLHKHAVRDLSKEEKVRALQLLEMQRNAMLMYTSCGWFFDEVSGVENIQIMRYASRAIQYAEELHDISLEPEYLRHLIKAPSNNLDNAARVYDMHVKRVILDLLRVGVHFAVSSIFEDYPEDTEIFCYTAKSEVYSKIEAGRLKLVIGKARMCSRITREEKTIFFAVLHFGDHNINAGVKDFGNDEEFSAMQDEIKKAFERGEIPEVIRLQDKYFGKNTYSLWYLFRDEQRKVLDQILRLTYEGVEAAYRQIYENNITIMNFYHSLQQRVPRPFFAAAEYIINTDLKKIFDEEAVEVERLKKLIDEARRWSVKIDVTTIEFRVNSWVNDVLKKLSATPVAIELIEMIQSVMESLTPLSLSLNLWEAQNIYFSIYRSMTAEIKEKAQAGDLSHTQWEECFQKLGHYLQVKI